MGINRRCFCFVCCVLCGLSLAACQMKPKGIRDLARTMKAFKNETICLPDRVLLVDGGTRRLCSIDRSLPLLVYYYGHDDCTDCVIMHLRDLTPIWTMAREKGTFEIAVIFSPDQIEMENVIDNISHRQFDFPVYIDIEEAMDSAKIPKDSRFHTFLLDKNLRPVMIGNPLSSEKMMQVFQKALSSIHKP